LKFQKTRDKNRIGGLRPNHYQLVGGGFSVIADGVLDFSVR
jgi:hypothetical protein